MNVEDVNITTLFRYCGSSAPETIVSSTNSLRIVFRSDFIITFQGFSASYIAYDPSSGKWLLEIQLLNMKLLYIISCCSILNVLTVSSVNCLQYSIRCRVYLLSTFKIKKHSHYFSKPVPTSVTFLVKSFVISSVSDELSRQHGMFAHFVFHISLTRCVHSHLLPMDAVNVFVTV